MAKASILKVGASLVIIAGLIFSLALTSIPTAQAADVPGFFFTENSYGGNANVSDRFVNNVGYVRLHGSVYAPEGQPEVTAKIWHTAGICLPGVIGDCQPGNLKIAEFNVPVVPDSRPDYYTFTNVPISGMIKPFTDGSWVGQIEAVVPEANTVAATSDYSWFWIETREPHLPELLSPANTGTVAEGEVNFDWTDVMDYVPPSGLLSGLQGYYFELYTDSSLSNKIFDSDLTGVSQDTVPGLMAGTYYWRVRAVDNVGNFTSWTAPWQFTIEKPEEPTEEPPPPPNDNPEDPRDNSDTDTDMTDSSVTTTSDSGTVAGTTTTAENIENDYRDLTTSAARILGAFSDEAEAAETEIAPDEGEVKGVANEVVTGEMCTAENFWWWLPLVIGFAVSLMLTIFARPGQRGWLVLPLAIAIFVQVGHWLWWGCNCATSPLCDWFWLLNVILLVVALIIYARRTRPYNTI